MQYIQVEKNRVKDIFCGPLVPKGMREVSKHHQLRVGDDVRFFREDGKRMFPEEAINAGLIKIGENQTAVWVNGQYKAVDDYSRRKYWNKETGQPVQLKTGQTPDNTLTEVERTDLASKWDKDKWVVPDEVKAERILAERDNLLRTLLPYIIAEFNFKDKNIGAYRDALIAIQEQPGFPESVEWPEVPE
jgi:hypothetical protein